MCFIGANVFVQIGETVEPVILAAILIIAGLSFFWYLGRTLSSLKKYGCEKGFAHKLKVALEDPASLQITKKLYMGSANVSESSDAVRFLRSKVSFDRNDRFSSDLLYDLIKRFISRPVQNLEKQLSLQSLSVEFSVIADIREGIDRARILSTTLPAVGLFGTLIGMFCAFAGADFNNPDMQNVMTELMNNFGMALWTTILAIIFKIAIDLWCSFTAQREMSVLTTELIQLKYYIFDIVEQYPLQSKKEGSTDLKATNSA
jgi:hypothetical protein